MLNSTYGGYNVSTSFNKPASSYLPFPSQDLVQQGQNQQNANTFANSDLRSLMQQFEPASNQGVDTNYKTNPGAMSNLIGPRAQAASSVMQNQAFTPYGAENANFNALLNEQVANAGQAFGIGSQAQNLGQQYQTYQLGQFGSNLGFLGNLLNQILGSIRGNTQSAPSLSSSINSLGSMSGLGGLGSIGGLGGIGGLGSLSDLGGLGSLVGSGSGVPGLTTG
ncbi:MAG: hypothetical protein KGL39_29285 [Patescibacteria group bacterium]|nr:hypothetical protein [Patescibacteria group bacterium]